MYDTQYKTLVSTSFVGRGELYVALLQWLLLLSRCIQMLSVKWQQTVKALKSLVPVSHTVIHGRGHQITKRIMSGRWCCEGDLL